MGKISGGAQRRNSPVVWTAAKDLALMRVYENEKSVLAVARTMNMSRNTINHRIRRWNLRLGQPCGWLIRLQELLDKGLRGPVLAAELECTSEYLKEIVELLGVELTPSAVAGFVAWATVLDSALYGRRIPGVHVPRTSEAEFISQSGGLENG